MNHRKLTNLTRTTKDTFTWLLFNELLPTQFFCIPCNKQMKVINESTKNKFRCHKCKNEKSLLYKTIYYNSNLEIFKAVDLIYWWSIDMHIKNAKHEIETTNSNTVCNWYAKLRFLVMNYMRKNTRKKIGGPGKIVQIDESLFSKRKYNVGRQVKKIWIVGGIQYDSNEVFFVETFYRNAESLKNIILENVELGTIIYTDCWAGYCELNSIGYFHFTVNHKTNFVDPFSGVNTQKIEGNWSVVKRWLKKKNISNRSDLFLYFAEFCFKRVFKNNLFIEIMKCCKYYDEIIN